MKRMILMSVVASSVCSSAYAIDVPKLQRVVDMIRGFSENGSWTTKEENTAIDTVIQAYWDTHPRTWSQWLFNDPPPGLVIPAPVGAVFRPSPFILSYGSFGGSPTDFLGSSPMAAYGLASVRYYTYLNDINSEVLLIESFDVANNFRTTFSSLGGFEPVIHAVPFDSQGNRITILDSSGENGADAFALVLGNVPEPQTWALAVFGIGVLAAVKKIRGQKLATSCAS